MKKYGLIGFPLTHSFSKKYFSEKFRKEGLRGCQYELYEIPNIQAFPALLAKEPDIIGLNVTIPYKQQVIPYLDRLETACREIGAVNCIKVSPDELVGFNTDYIGFRTSLENWVGKERPAALVLGTGGASNAVAQALNDLNISFFKVSRTSPPDSKSTLSYKELSPEIMADYHLIINTTPLGTYPNTSESPPIPLEHIGSNHWFYDLVYNPEETSLMKEVSRRGAKTKNGIEMLHLQAEAAWEIWNAEE
ncbi:shikimate dehydrogenase family protein [Cyclobacterium jeungdonense]|uniref:Shikimate dehydrogenase n=1 Tax=Cyclobacterium jeungdonense TaxID=708087 RepID=A0ABT8C7D6_9BACT|nr:shikimate dehydrogenase [Cyclobacterium jeungdonense]MDN3687723.1 shikimate dehydrogenase [Cyclobacterium jeungdonense]